MTLHTKTLLIEMREYTKIKIRNADLPAFISLTEKSRKLYNEVSCVDLSLYAEDAVIKILKKMITDEALEVEKINKNSTDKEKQKVIDRLVCDKQKIVGLAMDKIAKVYDNLVDAVDKHPELAGAILKLSETFSKNFNAILDIMTQYIEKIIGNIVLVGKTIWERIENTFREIVEVIAGWFSK